MANWPELSIRVHSIVEDAARYVRQRAALAESHEQEWRIHREVASLDVLRAQVQVIIARYPHEFPAEVGNEDRATFQRLFVDVEATGLALQELSETEPFDAAVQVLGGVAIVVEQFLSAGPHGPGKGRPPRGGRP